jgi:hypothetical protein
MKRIIGYPNIKLGQPRDEVHILACPTGYPKRVVLAPDRFLRGKKMKKNPLVVSSVVPSSQASHAAIDAVRGRISHLAGVGSCRFYNSSMHAPSIV